MRSNRKILVGLLLIVGAVGFYGAFRSLSHLRTAPKSVALTNDAISDPNAQTVSAKTPTGRIATARVDIPANSIVTPDMLTMGPSDVPSTKEYITDIEGQGAGFITRVDIPAGSKIRPANDFVGHVSETGIAGLLRPGTRAMIVPIANKPTLHDLVRIGNTIDVLAAFDGQESRTLIQNVRVLGVDVSANDFPNVSAAMRGPLKASSKTGADAGDGNGGASAAPAATPTPAPNAPRPDPALTLEVTPRQAAQLQLALASNATLDFLVRPALPGNRSTEIAPTEDGPDGALGTAGVQSVSVTKLQIAPYAENHKKGSNDPVAKMGADMMKSLAGLAGAAPRSGGPRLRRGGKRPLEVNDGGLVFPSAGGVTPAKVGGNLNTPNDSGLSASAAPAPTPQQSYSIPVYGDGKILRTETVPLPAPAS